MLPENRDIHIHLTVQPGTAVHITVADDSIQVAGDHTGPGGGSSPDGERLEAAIRRLEGSGSSRNIREAVSGLEHMGYALKLPETNVPGKRAENYLRIVDPEHAGRGVGYLTPSYFAFSRASDRERLSGLPGARLVSSAVNFDHAENAQPGLDAARLLKS